MKTLARCGEENYLYSHSVYMLFPLLTFFFFFFLLHTLRFIGAFHSNCREISLHHTTVFLPGESQGWGSLVGCHLWGHTELDTTEAT